MSYVIYSKESAGFIILQHNWEGAGFTLIMGTKKYPAMQLQAKSNQYWVL